MMVVLSTILTRTGANSAIDGRMSFTVACAANCAPEIVVVTYLPSPPTSLAMLVMTNGKASATTVTDVPAAAPDRSFNSR